MRLIYQLESGEDDVTPINVAQALIADEKYDEFELMEISNYLRVHCDACRTRRDYGLPSKRRGKSQNLHAL